MKRRAFTLVELLVVIAIIGILVGLLVPAVQSAREAGRRTQCSNNLNQLTKAAIQHETAHQYYPTGGWTGAWSGDPNFGTGQRQPGGWTYNILPFIEQQPLHDLGLTSNGAKAGPNVLGQAANTPLALFYCPTRRVASVYPIAAATCNSPGITTAAKTDYAASAGTNQSTGWTTAPTSGDPAAVARSLNGQFPDMSNISNGGFNGVIYTLSTTTHADIQNGSSNTLFFGEKYLDPLAYLSGSDPADNKPIFAGFANDWERFAANGPHHDTRGSPDPVSFGSAHVDGLNVFTCDGSGHWMSYSVDPLTFAMLCSRQNTNPIDASKLKW